MMYKKFICSLLVTSAAWTAAPVLAEPVKIDGLAAVVDARPILDSDVNARFQVVKDRIPGGILTDTIHRQIVNQLIEEALQVNYARKQGIRASTSEVDQAIMGVASNFNTDINGLKQLLANQGVDYKRYRQQIENEILIGKARQQVAQSRISVTEQEIEDFLQNQQADGQNQAEFHLRHIVVRASDVAEARAQVEAIADQIGSEQDFINQAIANSQGQFAIEGGDLGWRKANELPSLFTQAVSSQEEGTLVGPLQSNAGFHLLWVIEKRSQDVAVQQETKVSHLLLRPNEIRNNKQTRELAEQLHTRLEQGANFADLAREYSEDQGSTIQGGDLGWVTPGTMVPEFEEMMNKTPVGSISEPFQSQFGWHILEVDGRRQNDISDQVKRRNAERAIMTQKQDFVLDNWLSELRADAFIDRKSDS
ncbi:Chaperone SurA precursor [Marinomonas gallaica]|uniref:Chaperone SurA n=1 Tax=Marinomonas gallaica TaxID=1806667 RepID=A0A1C3JN94_9GAMM|nr:peptidylprolyl isomerase [Marinomonas gallaica]SBT16673.1 Chaperone SurA precursor [Marinomonas gallaica]SBT20389.1 Chaperone SurA precursor [Marinomonas gallaica]